MSLMTFDMQSVGEETSRSVEIKEEQEHDYDVNDTTDGTDSSKVYDLQIADASPNGTPGGERVEEKRKKRLQRKESFFAVKNAAVIVPRSQHQHARRYASTGRDERLHKQMSCQKIMSSTENTNAEDLHSDHENEHEHEHEHGHAHNDCTTRCDALNSGDCEPSADADFVRKVVASCPRKRISRTAMHSYLEAILSILELQDRIQVMVRLETTRTDLVRFLVIVSRQDDSIFNSNEFNDHDEEARSQRSSASSNVSPSRSSNADRESVSSEKSVELVTSRKASNSEACEIETSKRPSIVLGIDVVSLQPSEADCKLQSAVTANVGLVLPICSETTYRLDGDGGFSIAFTTTHRSRYWGNAWRLKPVSIQATYSALNTLKRCCDTARDSSFSVLNATRISSLIAPYEKAVADGDPALAADWNRHDETEQTGATAWQFALMTQKREKKEAVKDTGEKHVDEQAEQAKRTIDLDKLSVDHARAEVHSALLRVMVTLDLEEVSTKQLRALVESELGCSLAAYRGMFEQCVLVVMGQLEKPSRILDGLYLGSEWNASNLDELRRLNVRYVLNCARECDNFYTSQLRYMNVRVYDTLDADLLRFWPETHAFIDEARRGGSACLVHCKMGVSRSASTVMAYCMKERKWSLSEAFDHVKKSRPIAQPNENFMRQLATYEGILAASRRRPQPLDSSMRRGSSTASSPPNESESGN